ncbi:MAG: hypothetical protein ACFFAH_12230 [Promethearchaeota archaeon]
MKYKKYLFNKKIMPCIHGLDEINCPTCRIVNSSIPKSFFKINELYNNELKPYNPHFEQVDFEKEDYVKDLKPKKVSPNSNLLYNLPKPNLLNGTPNFKNDLLLDRLKELDIANSDIYKIAKKIDLKSPELKLKKEE